MAIASTNPATGEGVERFEELTAGQLEDKLALAAAAAESYRLTSVEDGAGWLRAAADRLESEADDVAELIVTEMGKTLRAARQEVAKCVGGLRFQAGHGPEFLHDVDGDGESVGARRTYVTAMSSPVPSSTATPPATRRSPSAESDAVATAANCRTSACASS